MQTFLSEYLDVRELVSACHIHHLLSAEILCQKPSSKRELLISLCGISILWWGFGVILEIQVRVKYGEDRWLGFSLQNYTIWARFIEVTYVYK